MKTTLLRRFHWPLFIAVFSSAHVAGLAYLYHDTRTATIGLVACFVAMGITTALNSIDESQKTIAEKYETPETHEDGDTRNV